MRVASGGVMSSWKRLEVRPRAGLQWLLAAAVVVVLPLSGADGKADPKAEEKKKEASKADYVGSETCQTCHEDLFKAFQKNPHYLVESGKTKKAWAGKTCEACHGPGSKHAESADPKDIVNPSKAAASRVDQNCLACHANQQTHAGRIQSGHAHNQVSCAACHSVHKEQGRPAAWKPAQINGQCGACHPSVLAQFQRPYAHKLPQGAMSCVDCHNPHGSFLPRMVAVHSGNEPSCIQCHGNKRGPFVYDHPPMQLEGCGACHEPHGSANPKMLTRAEVRTLCLECHSNKPTAAAAPGQGNLGGIPPAIHDLRSPRYRNCTTCHQKIHGSYVNRGFLR